MIGTLFNKAAKFIGRGATNVPARQSLTINQFLPPGGVTGEHARRLEDIHKQRYMRAMGGSPPPFRPFHPAKTVGVAGGVENYGRALASQSSRGPGAQRGSFNFQDVQAEMRRYAREPKSIERFPAGPSGLGTPMSARSTMGGTQTVMSASTPAAEVGRVREAINSGLSSVGNAASGLISGLDSNKRLISGLSAGLGWAERHGGVVGAGIGAATGFVASGGSGWGALTGAVGGGFTGAMGVNRYDVGSKSTRTRLSAGIGRKFTKHMKGMSYGMGPDTTRTYKSGRSGGMMIQKRSGHRRNLGGKRMGAHVVGGASMAGVGFLSGAATGFVLGTGQMVGNTFGNQMNAAYGNAFSGMGNGTVAGY